MSWGGTLTNFDDGVSWTGANDSDTTPTFSVLGGRYLLETYSASTPSAQLYVKDPSGNFVSMGSAVTTTATVFDLPAGAYQIVMGASVGSAGGSGSLIRVPYRAA